ncbi:hypothetical protein L9F63_013175 [Diploptera punctata]|uniref:Uncharacterized protein n=1 Tax=Diploptera punctata TaxID=6984 RepID=A0AAD8AAU6_DIPPU|nr:hypothetical protein L9F63_013175 [Diploptera punctata]
MQYTMLTNQTTSFTSAHAPDRRVIETHKYELADTCPGDIDSSPYQQPNLPLQEENWDAETPVTAYDPAEHLESAPIFRSLHGATKSQRKEFRLKERLRMQRLKDGEQPSSSSNDSSDFQEETNNAPVRLPREQPEALRLLNPNIGLGRGVRAVQNDNPANGEASFDLPFAIGMGRGKPITK